MRAKQQDLPELPNLGNNNFENLFIVDTDETGSFYYDLTDTLYIDIEGMDPSNFELYTIQKNDTLYSISRKAYDTYSLWWVIAVANNIDDPFELDQLLGEEIKILKRPVVGQILTLLDE